MKELRKIKKVRWSHSQIAMNNVIAIGMDRYGYGKTLPVLLGFSSAKAMYEAFSKIIGCNPNSIRMFVEELNPNSKIGRREDYYGRVRTEYVNISDLEILTLLKGILLTGNEN